MTVQIVILCKYLLSKGPHHICFCCQDRHHSDMDYDTTLYLKAKILLNYQHTQIYYIESSFAPINIVQQMRE